MLTAGQVGKLGSEDGDGAVTAVVAGCEFEPKSWLKRSPSEGLSPLACELPNMLPPPQPDNVSAATASAAKRTEGRPARATAQCFQRKSNMMQMSPDEFRLSGAAQAGNPGSRAAVSRPFYSSSMAANPRRL